MTKPKDLDSRFGMYLRGLIKQKQKDKDFKVPYIPGTASLPKTRTKRNWEYKNLPAIYMPVNIQLKDQTEYYIKTPQEMSRHEILELEKELRDITEFTAQDFEDDDFYHCDADGYVTTSHPEMLALQEEVRKMLPVREGIIRRYFDKHKY